MTTTKNSINQEIISTDKKSKRFPLVAIGASAGGLEAITEMLQNLDPETGMAYVYIQHLDPVHKSMLSTILSRATRMPVGEASNQLEVKPNHLYIIPPNKDMSVLDGIIQLKTRKPKPAVHLPIDHFFASLAEIYKEDSIGIVLSGNASDGSFGLKMIKKAGGITFAQDDSARFPSMPQSALAEGVVDMVLSPKQMAEELKRISDHLLNAPEISASVSNEAPAMEKEDLTPIIQLLKNSTGVDFTHYKANTIKRRIIRRMLLYKLDTLADYLTYLKEHIQEAAILYDDLLIHVTSFFRDVETTEYLKKTVIPRILKAKPLGEPIRVWVPACSTGEEAYTLAMLFLEVMEDLAINIQLQIFGTDLSEGSIAKARLGLYSRNDLATVSAKTIQRFLTKLDGGYRISKTIRDLCVFAPHNIFKDPPFSRMDLVSCCNLLIYLDPVLQKKVMATFHYSLIEKGILVLGKSESVGSYPRLFLQTDKKYKVFTRKKDNGSNVLPEMNYRLQSAAERTNPLADHKAMRKTTPTEMSLERTVDDILLNEYVPASVVVNQDLEIIQVRGSTSLFLQLSPGKASFNLMKMAHSDLAFELRTAIHRSAKSGSKFTKGGVLLRNKEETHQITIEASPLPSEGEEKLFLLVFKETGRFATKAKPISKRNSQAAILQEEISNLKEDIRSIIEEQQATVEELQSANEEIVSSNEELQSINEEMETSKEELESTNEELMTINSEMQVRNEQLSESYEYAESVFDTIREAVLVLDNELRVRSANRAFYSIFKHKQHDIEGALLFEMDNRAWNIPRLRELLEDIPPKNAIHGFEITHRFPRTGEKIMLINARRIVQRMHRRQTILIAIEDITGHRQAEKIIAEREAWLRNMADRVPVMIWGAGSDGARTFVNRTWLEFTGRKLEQEVGAGWKESIHPDDLVDFERVYNDSLIRRELYKSEYRLLRHDGEYRWMLDLGKPIFSAKHAFDGYLGSCTEIHDKKVTQEELEKEVAVRTKKLQEMNGELERSNKDLEQFAYVASHDLQEPLRKILTFSDRLENLKEPMPESALNYITKIGFASQRMSKLIDDLLNFSKITVNYKKFSTLDLGRILKNELTDFDIIMQDQNATVNIGQLPSIQGIEIQIEQLFHNLLSNSFKFARKDVPPVIDVTARTLPSHEAALHRNLDPRKNYMEILFADNGIGFREEFAEQIFTIFQRLNDKSAYPGTGIGLALCRKIIEYHGGEIFARSKPGHRTEFHIILPENHLD
jgi:two-component system CheB/CheR fusion protein